MEADAERLQQALINLVGNAAQASPQEGEVRLSARKARGRRGGAHRVRPGPRGAPGRARAILTPFYTTKKGGTGLGLAVVNKIAEAHGGSLEVGDNAPRGAAFSLRLPIKYAE